MGVCNCSMYCCTLLYVHSSIAIILMGKRELIALLNLSSWCLVMVERLFLAVPRGCLQFVIVVFPDHTHLLFLSVPFSIVVTDWETPGLLAILHVKFSCILSLSQVVSWVRCGNQLHQFLIFAIFTLQLVYYVCIFSQIEAGK